LEKKAEGRCMSKLAALATAVAVVVAVPTAAAYDLPLGATYDLPADLLAFIASTPSSKDFAVGSGRLAKGQPADGFNISAHGSPTDATGSVKFNSPTLGEIRGDVDCLAVSGNTAGVSGPITSPTNSTFERFIIGIEDNGEPSSPVRDRAVLILSTDPVVLPDCGLGDLLSTGAQSIIQGNLVVKDR
jgi:hypothetical protein